MDEIEFRPATRADVPAIVALLADDPLGATRESPDDLTPYLAAFDRISADADQLVVVADDGTEVIGTCQLTVLPGLALRGATRGQIEAVRVAAALRGRGVGAAMMQWALAEFRRRGVRLAKLTSNTTRADAHRFYTRLGFHPTHTGFTLPLD